MGMTLMELIEQSEELKRVWAFWQKKWPELVLWVELMECAKETPIMVISEEELKTLRPDADLECLGMALSSENKIWFKQIPPDPVTFTHELMHLYAGFSDVMFTKMLEFSHRGNQAALWAIANWMHQVKEYPISTKIEMEERLGSSLEVLVYDSQEMIEEKWKSIGWGKAIHFLAEKLFDAIIWGLWGQSKDILPVVRKRALEMAKKLDIPVKPTKAGRGAKAQLARAKSSARRRASS